MDLRELSTGSAKCAAPVHCYAAYARKQLQAAGRNTLQCSRAAARVTAKFSIPPYEDELAGIRFLQVVGDESPPRTYLLAQVTVEITALPNRSRVASPYNLCCGGSERSDRPLS